VKAFPLTGQHPGNGKGIPPPEWGSQARQLKVEIELFTSGRATFCWGSWGVMKKKDRGGFLENKATKFTHRVN